MSTFLLHMIKKDHTPLSTGGVNLFPKLGLAFMWAGCTVPEARGRGIYSALVTERMRHAKARGIAHLGLYAMRDTSGPIVQAQGFEKTWSIFSGILSPIDETDQQSPNKPLYNKLHKSLTNIQLHQPTPLQQTPKSTNFQTTDQHGSSTMYLNQFSKLRVDLKGQESP